MHLLLSIHRRFVDQIKNGDKGYEYRQGAFDLVKVNNVYVYETAPIKKITGKLIISKIIQGTPEEVWSRLDKSKTATSKADFLVYYKGKSKAYAWEVKNFIPINPIVDPWLTIPKFWPPVSFQHIDFQIESHTEGASKKKVVNLS